MTTRWHSWGNAATRGLRRSPYDYGAAGAGVVTIAASLNAAGRAAARGGAGPPSIVCGHGADVSTRRGQGAVEDRPRRSGIRAPLDGERDVLLNWSHERPAALGLARSHRLRSGVVRRVLRLTRQRAV
ncbi:hypothetical protein GCM10017589_55630 [Streptomyces poonensis]|nr:hypothetical protein GCM10017589_55630 [Streptomyces poonensis]